ncbi:Rid family hydrolase [Buchnera aphidicola]|uniref:Rid family hydrolase n=1 Tax=Buchnera aphidicola TaxID=9 RepID=UPI0031B6BCE1
MKIFTEKLKNFKKYGPYSHTVKAGNFFFTSGQIFVENDQKTKIFPNLYTQTLFTLKKIKKLLLQENLKISDIIKTTIFTTKLSEIKIINQAYEFFFKKHTQIYPARSCVGVLDLPYKAFIEIETISYVSNLKN